MPEPSTIFGMGQGLPSGFQEDAETNLPRRKGVGTHILRGVKKLSGTFSCRQHVVAAKPGFAHVTFAVFAQLSGFHIMSAYNECVI